MIMESAKNGMWIIPCMKIGMVRVNALIPTCEKVNQLSGSKQVTTV